MIRVVGEPGPPIVRTAVQASVIDEDEAVPDGIRVVRPRVDLNQGEGADDGGVGGDAVEADFGGGVGDEGEEIGVGAAAGGVLGPGGAPAEDEGALDGGVEARGVGLAVVVVVDGEGAEVVAAGGEAGEDVAVLLAGGEGEVAERLLLGLVEAEGLGDDGGGAPGEVAVGEPRGVEGVDDGGVAAAVDVVRDVAVGVRRWSGGGEEREEEEEEEREHAGSLSL